MVQAWNDQRCYYNQAIKNALRWMRKKLNNLKQKHENEEIKRFFFFNELQY